MQQMPANYPQQNFQQQQNMPPQPNRRENKKFRFIFELKNNIEIDLLLFEHRSRMYFSVCISSIQSTTKSISSWNGCTTTTTST